MTANGPDPWAWSRFRWWATISLVMAGQVGVIFLFSERQPARPRRPDFTSSFNLVTDAPSGSAMAELLNIEDPTLFALPDPRGFSGPAWMSAPAMRHQSRDWTEPQRWLSLPVATLGAAFSEFVRTNIVGPRLFADKPAPRLSQMAAAPVPLREKSSFRIEGDLAGRELVAPLEIPSIPHTDILKNTVVQVGVSPLGFTFSPPVVLSSSGSKTADQRALDLAKSARFKPVPRTGPASASGPPALTWGKFIFQWHTVELSATNSPAAQSPP